MLYYLADFFLETFGPFRLFQSYAVLIGLALFTSFFVTVFMLPKLYNKLPTDRGREFTINAEAAKGKPTGAGCIFITIFAILVLLFVPLKPLQLIIIALTWLTMLTGFLDDRADTSWGEYKKALLDLIICVLASFALYFFLKTDDGIQFWVPFISKPVQIAPWLYIIISTVLLWVSINTTNCTDGVDGLSGTLVLLALITMGIIFYFILGHTEIASYLLVPHIEEGATWALITFTLAGCLMGYLWHNAFPSKVLMGDAGSRALGFFIGIAVLISGNPFLIFATSSIIIINGGMGLLKVFLLRFFKIKIFENIRFPLHDHMRKNKLWSPTQVLIKFFIIQVLITIAVVGIFFKVR